MAEAAEEQRSRRSLAAVRQSPWLLWCSLCLTASLVYFAFFGLRFADETQQQLRLIPYLPYAQRLDFNFFYAAADMTWHGAASDLYPEPGEVTLHPNDPLFLSTPSDYAKARLLARGNFYNPPGFAYLYAPLAGLHFRAAYWTFSFLSGSALLAFLFLSWRAGRGIPELPLLGLGIVSFKPVHEAIIMGHPALFICLILGGGYLALRAEKRILAGLIFSLLVLKPQWAVLPALFLIVRGEWRSLGTMATAGAVIFFVPFLFTGFHTLSDYYHFLRMAANRDIGDGPHMFSWNGFLFKLRGGPLHGVPPPPREWVYALIALTLVPLAVVWAGRDYLLGVAATIIAMLLISTHSVWYDWSFLIVAALFMVLRTRGRDHAYRVQVWVLLIAIHVAAIQSMAVLLAPDRHNPDFHASGFYSLTLVAFATLLWLAWVTVREGLLPAAVAAFVPIRVRRRNEDWSATSGLPGLPGAAAAGTRPISPGGRGARKP